MTKSKIDRQIEEYVAQQTQALLKYVREDGRLAVVKAPPGSGKTYLLMQAVRTASKERQRIAIATQTRSQADDICRRLMQDFNITPVRFAAASSARVKTAYPVITDKNELPDTRPCVVVATSAKWGMISLAHPFDVLFVDEAWQLAWADFMLLGQVAGRFVLIGDPGQIPPVVTIDTGRWETSPRAPHHPAPEHVLRHAPRDLLKLDLPATRRLPADTVDYIRPFYDFPFKALAQPGERLIRVSGRSRDGIDAALAKFESGSVVALTLPTQPEGPPLEDDAEIAELAAKVAARLLERRAEIVLGDQSGHLEADQVGLCATHRIMNAAMELRLPARLRKYVNVDTPERWQGLERHAMVIAHPLSGVTNPSDFDLETGRLCVMASRHKAGLVIVARDHITHTLDSHLPVAEQPVGRPDVSGRGHYQNTTFWSRLVTLDRVVAM